MTLNRFVSPSSFSFIHAAKLPSFRLPTWETSCQSSELRRSKQKLLSAFQCLSGEQYLANTLFKPAGWYKSNPKNSHCSEIIKRKHVTVLVIKSYDCLHLWWFSVTGKPGIKTGQLFQSSCWWNKSQYREAVWSTKQKISEQTVTVGVFWPPELRNSQTARLKGIKKIKITPSECTCSDNISSKCFCLFSLPS